MASQGKAVVKGVHSENKFDLQLPLELWFVLQMPEGAFVNHDLDLGRCYLMPKESMLILRLISCRHALSRSCITT